ncbi:hypothetical protein [Paraburkholderia dilworthii]|uniref:hypothetical protein n=1 Tax=Paraburkholderia dilworthii TaxID=948106 RepID=UPI000405AEF8|nr:hypothetical protein [Paraburkholderia dilworthii]
MEDNDYLAAFAFCVTVDAIRKAQGKMMPEDLPVGSMERMLAIAPNAVNGLQDEAEE